MTHRVRCLALLILWGCGEVPTEPSALRPLVPHSAARSHTGSCDIYWMIASDGDWNDSTRWSPSRVPTYSDHVCFTSNGVFSVDLGGSTRNVLELTVEANTAVTFETSSAASLVADYITVDRLGRITMDGLAGLHADYAATVGGNLTLRNTVGNGLDYLAVTGLLELESARIDGDLMVDGEVRLTGLNRVDGYSASFVGGWVHGSGTLSVTCIGPIGSVTWSGTALPSRLASGAAPVTVATWALSLPTSGASGALDLSPGISPPDIVIDGSVIAGVDVALTGAARYVLLGGQGGSPDNFAVDGDFSVRSTSGSVELRVDTLINRSRFAVVSGGTTVNGYGIRNAGTITTDGALTIRNEPAPTYVLSSRLTNRGLLQANGNGEFVLGPRAELLADSGSRHVGRLRVQSTGVVTGFGTLDRVSAQGGYIQPGTATTPVGTLTFATLTLDAASRFDMDLSGTSSTQHDRIRVTNALHLAGRFNIDVFAPFTGGVCGQVITPITYQATTAVTGSFDSYLDLQPATDRAWRFVPTATGQMLTGYDPTRAFSVSPTLVAVAEPGSRATVAACLGGAGPTATVTVTPAARRGQVTSSPSSLAFTTANWNLPQLLNILAIDDALSEGPHRDTVRFSLSGPNSYYSGKSASEVVAVITDDDPPADLALTLLAVDPTVAVNANFEAAFRVSNVGTVASTGSVVQIAPMTNMSFVRVNGAATCSAAAGVLSCTIGPQAPGGVADFTVVFTATTAGVAVSTATLSSTVFDGNLANNVVVWSIPIS